MCSMCYTTWDSINCFSKNHTWPRAKLQVPSLILLPYACEQIQNIVGLLLGAETKSSHSEGREEVSPHLSQGNQVLWKISPENSDDNPYSKLHFSLHIKLHNGS